LALLNAAFSIAQENTQSDTSYVLPYFLYYEGSDFSVDGNYRYKLEEVASIMQKKPDAKLLVRGHVCCGPSYKLSKRRAKQVYKYLLNLGVDKNRMNYKGCSDEVPMIFPEEDEEDEAKNRRVDFLIFLSK
jgi:outer membrane protein OmpA-like peptidoglycan-associated protein